MEISSAPGCSQKQVQSSHKGGWKSQPPDSFEERAAIHGVKGLAKITNGNVRVLLR